MSHYKLDHLDQAREGLAKLRALMSDSDSADAEALIEPKGDPPASP